MDISNERRIAHDIFFKKIKDIEVLTCNNTCICRLKENIVL